MLNEAADLYKNADRPRRKPAPGIIKTQNIVKLKISSFSANLKVGLVKNYSRYRRAKTNIGNLPLPSMMLP